MFILLFSTTTLEFTLHNLDTIIAMKFMFTLSGLNITKWDSQFQLIDSCKNQVKHFFW